MDLAGSGSYLMQHTVLHNAVRPQGLMQSVYWGVAGGAGGMAGAVLHGRLGGRAMFAVGAAAVAGGWALLTAAELVAGALKRRRPAPSVTLIHTGHDEYGDSDEVSLLGAGAVLSSAVPVIGSSSSQGVAPGWWLGRKLFGKGGACSRYAAVATCGGGRGDREGEARGGAGGVGSGGWLQRGQQACGSQGV